MKKTFTFLFATAMLTTAFAQYDPKDEWDNDKGNVFAKEGKPGRDKHDDLFRGTYYFTPREMDMQILQINREYDYKVRSVRNKFYMGRYQIMRQLRFLEDQRNRKIQSVIARFKDRRNQFHNNTHRNKKNW